MAREQEDSHSCAGRQFGSNNDAEEARRLNDFHLELHTFHLELHTFHLELHADHVVDPKDNDADDIDKSPQNQYNNYDDAINAAPSPTGSHSRDDRWANAYVD
jgi:hypothetical protein